MPGTVCGTENMDTSKHTDKHLRLAHFTDIHRSKAATGEELRTG